jgi:hypothetical protein
VSCAHATAGVKNAMKNRTAGNKLSLTASDFMLHLPGLARQKLQLSRRAELASEAIIRPDSHRAIRKLSNSNYYPRTLMPSARIRR